VRYVGRYSKWWSKWIKIMVVMAMVIKCSALKKKNEKNKKLKAKI
jgi:hypothetical protein